MTDHDFYVTLPSNGASDVYPRNRPTCYRTDLSINKRLLTDWEVGLAQIQFTHNWNYSTPEFTFMAFICKTGTGFSQTNVPGHVANWQEKRLRYISPTGIVPTSGREMNMNVRVVKVPAFAQWRHVDELGSEVAKCIEKEYADGSDTTHSISVKYSRVENTTTFTVTEHNVGGDLFLGLTSEDDELFQILGINPRRESSRLRNQRLKVYLFKETPPIPRTNGFANVETIFVYTDVVEEQVVGSSSGTLLKLVPVTSKKGERQCSEYGRPSYVPVQPTSLKSIEIKICDLAGEELLIWDPNSLVTVVLHFRKRKRYDAGWC
jgi:hypothetical protein